MIYLHFNNGTIYRHEKESVQDGEISMDNGQTWKRIWGATFGADLELHYADTQEDGEFLKAQREEAKMMQRPGLSEFNTTLQNFLAAQAEEEVEEAEVVDTAMPG